MDFQFQRFLQLAKIRLTQRSSTFGWWLLGVFGVYSLIFFVIVMFSANPNEFDSYAYFTYQRTLYIGLIIIGAMVAAALSWKELQNGNQLFSGVMLPASTFEKWAFEWFLSFISWFVVGTVLYFLYAQVCNFFVAEYRPFEFEWFTFKPYNLAYEGPLGYLEMFKYFALYHSFMFLGPTFLRKKVIVKLFVILGVLNLIWVWVFYNVWIYVFPNLPFTQKVSNFIEVLGTQNEWSEGVVNAMILGEEIVWLSIIPVLFYIWSYKRVKQMQL